MDGDVRRQYFDTPPLRYVGSKWQLAGWIIEKFPPHHVYVEPYCGGASVFFRKHRSPVEVLNDLDGEVVNFFQVLRTRRDALLEQIQLTPWSRQEYLLSLEPAPEADTLERARRFYVSLWQSFGRTLIYNSGWARQKNANMRSPLVDTWRRMDGLLDAAERLKDAQVEHKPAFEVILDYDGEDTLFYCDPPYVLSARADGGRYRYRNEMTDAEHRKLAEMLHEVDGMVILSGYHCALYDALYGDWLRFEKSTTTSGNGQAVESLWLSPRAAEMLDQARSPLFFHGRGDGL